MVNDAFCTFLSLVVPLCQKKTRETEKAILKNMSSILKSFLKEQKRQKIMHLVVSKSLIFVISPANKFSLKPIIT